MKNHTIIPFLLLIAILLSACFALEAPEESSGAVAAPTLAPQEQPPVSLEEAEEAAAVPTAEPAAEAPTDEPPEEAVEAYPAPQTPPTEAAPAAEEAYPAEETAVEPQPTEPPQDYPAQEESSVEGSSDAASGETLIYEIDPARSAARFTINEVLQGAPKTVVGVSSNLGGQIALDLNDPSAAHIGTILVNARDFATDNEFRNNAIANKILLANEHEFITFEPTAVSGMPETAVIGETYEIQISGNLTIIGQTREVTFDAQVTPLSEKELAGLATLDILYADYGVTIPFARSVESVEDNVLLELEFIATAQ